VRHRGRRAAASDVDVVILDVMPPVAEALAEAK
jgi:hypothetical protein